ncbi:MAG: hypothetical protein U1D55_05720 [Phycisphaerae bacterium]
MRVDNADNNVLETFGSDYQGRCVVRRGFRGEKFVATFKFKWNGSSSTSPGFLVRWLNPGDWVAVCVKSSDGKARLDRRKDDGVVTNLATGANALSLTSGTWYSAKVVVDDDPNNSALQRLRFYVDANANGFGDDAASLDTTAVDDDFSAGYCGLFRSNLYADTQQFDDFKLGIDNSSPKDGDFDDAGDELVIDDNFNSTTTSLTYDDNGNLTDDGVFKYVYDAWNRLVKVTWRIKASPSTVATYAYDGRYRRISKAITNSGVEYWPNDGGNTTLHFYYDRSAFLIEARNGSDRTVAQYGREVDCDPGKTLFVDVNGDSSGNDTDPDTTAGGESAYADKRYYFHFDRGRRVVALTEYVPSGGSGVAGRVVERFGGGLWAESIRGDSGSGESGSSAGQRVGWQPQSSGRGGLGGVPCEPHGGHRSVAGRKQSGHCIPAPNIDCWPVPDPWPNPWPSPAPEPIPGPLPTPIPMGPCFNPCPDPGPVPGPSPEPTPAPTPGPITPTCTIEFRCWMRAHCQIEIVRSAGGTGDCGCGPGPCIDRWRTIQCFPGGCVNCTFVAGQPSSYGTLVTSVTLPESACVCLRAHCSGYPNYSCWAGAISNSTTGLACLNNKCALGIVVGPPGYPGWFPAGTTPRPCPPGY